MITAIEQKHIKKNIPDFHVGDTIRVHQKIKEGNKERVQIFEGVVLAKKHGKGITGSFVVRKISLGVGVEKNFPLHLPSIIKIEKIKTAHVRRAKLYYLRDLKGRAARLKKEIRESKVWEEPEAEKELEAIKEEQEQAAEEKAKIEAEEASQEEIKLKEKLENREGANEPQKEESGDKGGKASSESAEK